MNYINENRINKFIKNSIKTRKTMKGYFFDKKNIKKPPNYL
jgi:hypothetical protein